MHLPTFKWTSSFLYETVATNVLLLQTNDKHKVGKKNTAFPYLFLHIHTYICIN